MDDAVHGWGFHHTPNDHDDGGDGDDGDDCDDDEDDDDDDDDDDDYGDDDKSIAVPITLLKSKIIRI